MIRKILYICSFLVLLLPFVTIRGCRNEKFFSVRRSNETTIKADSILLLYHSSDKKYSDLLKEIMKKSKEKEVEPNNDTCFHGESYRGYQILIFAIDPFSGAFSVLILIELAFIIQFLGLILIFIKKFQTSIFKIILSSFEIFIGLFIIQVSLFLYYSVKINYGLWLYFILVISCFALDVIHYKRKIKTL